MAIGILKVPITLNITVSDVNVQLAAGFEEIRIERSTTLDTGPFVEITAVGPPRTRPQLTTDKTLYQFIDDDGTEVYWYRFRLQNQAETLLGTFSTAFQIEDEALAVCSIKELKDFYLFGIDLTDDAGKAMPDALFAHYIKWAVDIMEKELDVPIRPITLESDADQMDYYREDYDKYIWIELSHFPVIEVEEVKLVLPGEAVVQVFNREWIHIDRWTGQLRLVPGTGTAGTILLGASGAWIPLIYGNNRHIPHVFRIKYRAGFGRPSPGAIDSTPSLTGPKSVPDPILDRGVPRDIKHAVGMIASMGPFNIAGDLLGGAGIASQSIGIDGLSQSFATTSSATNAGFGARIIQYQKDLKNLIPKLRSYYKGISMRVM